MKNTITGLFLSIVAMSLVAEEFPSKPVTLIVPYGAGGPTDVIARKIAVPLSKQLGQPVVVENRPSTGGVVGMEAVLRSKPDGYTLFINNNGMATLNVSGPNLKFNAITDFAPIGQITENPMVLVGKRTLAPVSFVELKKYIVDHRRTINIASGGIGTTSHLCALALLEQLNIDIMIIPYKGVAPALIDLQSGQVDLLCDQITVTQQHIRSGKIKAYGVTSLRRAPTLPDVPTLNEQGLRGFKQQVWHALYTTKNTPPEIIQHLNQAVQFSLKDSDFQDSLKTIGAVVVSNNRVSPARVLQDLIDEQAKWQPLVLKDRIKNQND